MRKLTAFLLLGMVVLSAGFAAAAIGSHGGLLRALEGTTTSTTVTSTNPSQRRVTLCHVAGKKHHRTITVAQAAVAAHLRHGDQLGACVGTSAKSRSDEGAEHHGVTAPVTAATTTTTTTDSDDGPGHSDAGHGNSGHGSSNASGNASQGHGDR